MTDAEIVRTLAERVMGWKTYSLQQPGYADNQHEHRLIENVRGQWNYFAPGESGVLFDPLTSISDAFMVVEKMQSRGFEFSLFTIGDTFFTAFTLPKERDVPRQSELTDQLSAPRAICLAAISATSQEPK